MSSQISAAHPQAVLCDLDGMLLDSNTQHAQAWQRAFEHFGISTTIKQVLQQIGKGGDNLIPVFVPEPDRARLQKPLEECRKELFRRVYLSHMKAFSRCPRPPIENEEGRYSRRPCVFFK